MSKKNTFRLRFKVHKAGCVAFIGLLLLMQSVDVFVMVLALAVHEMGHILMMLLVGASLCTIEITPFGGMADVSNYEQLSTIHQLLISSGGILINACLVWVVVHFFPMNPFWISFSLANFLLALFNGFPAWPLDGGRMLVCIGRRIGCERLLLKITTGMTYLLALGLLALGCYGAWIGTINLSLFIIPPYLCYAAKTSTMIQHLKRIGALKTADHKLRNAQKLPVKCFAWGSETDISKQYQLLRELPNDYYHLFVTISPEDGLVQSVETETSLIRRLFDQKHHPQKPL